MGKLALTVARFAVSAWVGAAVLFVITSVREVRYGGFDSTIRDELAALRFPPYYVAGFLLIGTSIVCAAVAWKRLTRRRMLIILGILVAALALMLADYFWIYGPLADMITPPGQSRPERFERLHVASEWVNSANVLLCLIAAALLNWPGDGRKEAQESQKGKQKTWEADLH
jgi:hypothetical protein